MKKMTGSSSREVCGIALAPGASCLASGGDDGIANLWDLRMMQKTFSILAHTACVKV